MELVPGGTWTSEVDRGPVQEMLNTIQCCKAPALLSGGPLQVPPSSTTRVPQQSLHLAPFRGQTSIGSA